MDNAITHNSSDQWERTQCIMEWLGWGVGQAFDIENIIRSREGGGKDMDF